MGKDSPDSFLIKTYKISYDLSPYCMKQIDSMYPCIGPEIDHFFVLIFWYFDVICDILPYYWTDAQQHGICLLNIQNLWAYHGSRSQPAPSWPDSSTGRALQQHCRGQALSHSGLNFSIQYSLPSSQEAFITARIIYTKIGLICSSNTWISCIRHFICT